MTKPPGKDPRFIDRSVEPWTGGPPLDLLVRDFITPVSLFFVRNHGPVPAVDARSWRLAVGGLVSREREWSFEDLQRAFTARTVTVTLQCAGNRRRELMDERPIEGEVPWGPEAIGNADWTGVLLSDVLEAAGLGARARHVEFLGLDDVHRNGRNVGFGGSVPVSRAADPGVLLAWEMNGRPLSAAHGFPLRAVVPGTIGARSVKWLRAIRVREDESPHYFQQAAYKVFPPSIDANSADWSAAPALQEFPVNAVLCRLEADRGGATARARGYAVSGYGTVENVEVSPDGGRSWIPAAFEDSPRKSAAWRLWNAEIPLSAVTGEIVVRAADSSGAQQPPYAAPLWNFKGYMNNAWHHRQVALPLS